MAGEVPHFTPFSYHVCGNVCVCVWVRVIISVVYVFAIERVRETYFRKIDKFWQIVQVEFWLGRSGHTTFEIWEMRRNYFYFLQFNSARANCKPKFIKYIVFKLFKATFLGLVIPHLSISFFCYLLDQAPSSFWWGRGSKPRPRSIVLSRPVSRQRPDQRVTLYLKMNGS